MEKTVQKIPFLRLTIAFATGILLGSFLMIPVLLVLMLLFAITVFLLLVQRNYNFRYNTFFGIGTNVFLILLGIFVFQQYNKKPVFFEKGTFIATVLEKPQEKTNTLKTVLHTSAIILNDSIFPADEKVNAYLRKNKNLIELNPGDIILFNQPPQWIKNNGNPFEFDYKKYLELKKIYRQVFLSDESWEKTTETNFSITTLAEKTRDKLLYIFKNQPIDKTELEILSALTLGYKRDLDPETKRIFSSAGAMHVLAVSGLHVGIIFWIISLHFGFLKKSKKGRFLFIFLVISILTFYAFLTGLSPSVMRASLMFSFYIIGDNLHRKANIYNSLAASAFLLLLINPNNIFDIGFQLSYSAVFGIVYLQPKLGKLIIFNNRILRFIWSLFTVSVAAQIATAPFTLFYFGQFPLYFWLTNIFIIPSVMILVPLGIALLIFAKIELITTVISFCLNHIIKLIYHLLSIIEKLPFAVLHIKISPVQTLILILFLISLFTYLKNQRNSYLKLALISVLLISLTSFISKTRRLITNELIVYNTSSNTVIQLIHGFKNYIVSENKILYDDYVFREINATNQNLDLNLPIFLNSSDTLISDDIFVENGIIFFEGKSILLNKKSTLLDNKSEPDFFINPIAKSDQEMISQNCQIIITNIRFKRNLNPEIYRFHNTVLEGAFRKKW